MLPLNKLNSWIRGFFALGIFMIPFQLNEVLYQMDWGRGFVNPYTTIRLYSSEVFFLIAGVLFLIQLFKKEKPWTFGSSLHFLSLSILAVTVLLSFMVTPLHDPVFQGFLFIKVLEILLLYFLIVNQTLQIQTLVQVFVGTMLFQSCLALFQVLSQGSFGLYFLGEPHLSAQGVHLARFEIFGKEFIRAYGTFSHPNVLAGYLGVSLLFSLLIEKLATKKRALLVAVQSLALMVTFSRLSILVFSLVAFLLLLSFLPDFKKRKIWLPLGVSVLILEVLAIFFYKGMAIFQSTSFLERLAGYKDSFSLFKMHPFGIGFSQVTLFLDGVHPTPIMPWEYQPIHSVPFLVLNELGFLGLFAGIFALVIFFKMGGGEKNTSKKLHRKKILILAGLALCILSLFDHYLLTLDQGRFLIIILFSLSSLFAVDGGISFPLTSLKPHQN